MNEENKELIAKAQSEISSPTEDILKDVVAKEKNKKENEQKPKEHKKLKHGMMSTILTIVFVAVVVLVNVVATVLFDRYPVTIDLTKDKIYSISDKSEEYVKKIDTDVLITVFAEEEAFKFNTYTRQADEVMKKYSKYNNKIKYRYVDIDSNPDIVKDYTSDSINDYDIIVETNPTKEIKRTRKITLVDLVNFEDDFVETLSNYGIMIDNVTAQSGNALNALNSLSQLAQQIAYTGNIISGSNADQAFTSALMTVTDPNPITVTFLTGRNEVDELAYFKTLLTANGYTVNTVDITSDDIPEDTTVAVVPAPQTDYLPDDVKKLDNFLDNNGKLGKQLLYIASAQQQDTPNLDEFLKDYGLQVGKGIICESNSSNYYNQPYLTIATDLSENFMQDVATNDPQLIIQTCRPVKQLFDEKNKIKTEGYVKSTSDAYLMDPQSQKTTEKGQQNYMAVSSRVTYLDGNDAVYSNVIAAGTEFIFRDDVLPYTQYQNREYVLSLLNGITHKTDGIVIEPKTIDANVYDITASQQSVLKWTFILIVPVIVLAIGLVIWLRRKHR